MELHQLIQQFNPPCPQCPYKLGLVYTVANPCPQCKENGYQMFDRFQRERMTGGQEHR